MKEYIIIIIIAEYIQLVSCASLTQRGREATVNRCTAAGLIKTKADVGHSFVELTQVHYFAHTHTHTHTRMLPIAIRKRSLHSDAWPFSLTCLLTGWYINIQKEEKRGRLPPQKKRRRRRKKKKRKKAKPHDKTQQGHIHIVLM